MPPTASSAERISLTAESIKRDSIWYNESLSSNDKSPAFSGQSDHDRGSKRSSAPPTIHTFSLAADAQDIPIMTVNLHSWAPSSKGTPTFVEGHCISGVVQLNLRTPDKIKDVSVLVEGYYSIPGYEAKTFLHVSETLWDCTMGDPRSSGVSASEGADRSYKLHGMYSWSFKIDFPRTVETLQKEKKGVHDIPSGEKLPPSLRDGHGQARIGYEIVVRIKRPGLRFGSSLKIPISYTISTQPPPGSLLRRIAYQNKRPAPSLFDDPSGWRVFPEFPVRGSLHKTQALITCTLALASPLSYALGSFIPGMLILSSSNERVLEAISAPSVPQMHLRRRLVLYSKMGGELALDGQEKIISKARWTSVHESSTSLRKILRGEINVPSSALPSFAFGKLEMKYDVLVFPFEIPGFSRIESGTIFRADVSISSFLEEGPYPVSQIP